MDRDATIGDVLRFSGDSAVRTILSWSLAANTAERLEVLRGALDRCYEKLVDARGIIVGKDRGEDELSMQVVQMLQMAGFQATHDTHVNGHCDIVVTHGDGFRWLGEAKVHKDYAWLEKGFLQLSTRYGTAMPGRNNGEVIIYHSGGNAAAVLREWSKRMQERFPDVELVDDSISETLSFLTTHTCSNAGIPFHVRHVIVPLQHAPVD